MVPGPYRSVSKEWQIPWLTQLLLLLLLLHSLHRLKYLPDLIIPHYYLVPQTANIRPKQRQIMWQEKQLSKVWLVIPVVMSVFPVYTVWSFRYRSYVCHTKSSPNWKLWTQPEFQLHHFLSSCLQAKENCFSFPLCKMKLIITTLYMLVWEIIFGKSKMPGIQ